MFAPAVFGALGSIADSGAAGALVSAVAVTRRRKRPRAWRFINVLFGAWLVAATWFLGGPSAGAKWNYESQ